MHRFFASLRVAHMGRVQKEGVIAAKGRALARKKGKNEESGETSWVDGAKHPSCANIALVLAVGDATGGQLEQLQQAQTACNNNQHGVAGAPSPPLSLAAVAFP
jgi:hypothetical protein